MMSARFQDIAASLLAITVIASAVSADEVHLHNGDRLTGTITAVAEDVLTLSTDYAGELKVERDAIKAIETDDPRDVVLDDDTTLSGRLLISDDDDQQVEGSEEPVPFDRIAALVVPGTEEVPRPSWKGFADAVFPQAEMFRQARAAAAAVDVQTIVARGLRGEAVGEELRRARVAAVAKALRLRGE